MCADSLTIAGQYESQPLPKCHRAGNTLPVQEVHPSQLPCRRDFGYQRSPPALAAEPRIDRQRIDAPPRLHNVAVDAHRVISPDEADQLSIGAAIPKEQGAIASNMLTATKPMTGLPARYIMQSSHRGEFCPRESSELRHVIPTRGCQIVSAALVAHGYEPIVHIDFRAIDCRR